MGMELSGNFFVENIDFLQEIVVELSQKNKDILDKIFGALENFVPKKNGEVTYWSLFSKYLYSQRDGYRKDHVEWGEVIFEKSHDTGRTFKNITFIPALGNTYTVGNYSRKMDFIPPPTPNQKSSSKVYNETLMGNILNSLLYQIQQFVKDVNLYNQWIKAELPYYFRKGIILHKEFNKACSKFDYSPYRDSILDRIRKNEITYFPEMTLGIYGSLWGIAYQSLTSISKQESPLESFYKSNLRFTYPDEFDYNNMWNNQATFQNWLQEGSHQFDLIYARVSLIPKKGPSGWRIALYCNQTWHTKSIFEFYKAITDTFDIGLDIEKDMYCDILEGNDYIKIENCDRSYYYLDEKVYMGISLHSLEKSERSKVIELASWDNIENYYLKLKKKSWKNLIGDTLMQIFGGSSEETV